MLELKNIVKEYPTGNSTLTALRGINIAFRKSEFVAILGQSGCGKTTLLNIIGGLDKYTEGDLIINGISTKEYKDANWDAYRNHSIGFVFQSYNLIPHQSVLANVELALTLSGVSKTERKERAIEALNKVGLGDQLYKKPNQMSGGQMQRVAIARALVNNPDILLADEPTGALDSETSIQIMDILKEIAKEKLVIMVTHNPELAATYANRIVKLLDGKIIGDSNPYTPKYEEEKDKKEKKIAKNKSMSFWTALSLSFNNLLTKKGRTILTAIAGSIGIIGIALILSISTGVNNYIDTVQQETLSSFPIQIEKESTNMSALISSLMGVDTEEPADGIAKEDRTAVYGNPVMYKMMKAMLNAEVSTNNLEKFKVYLDEHNKELSDYTTAIQYGYNIKLNIYSTDPNGEYAKADFMDLMSGVFEGGSMSMGLSSMMDDSSGMTVWQELLTDPKTGEISSLIESQYDLIHGTWPKEKNEILLVLNENNEISDVTLYSLGLVDKQTMINATMAAMMGKEDNGWDAYEGKSWSYEDICNINLKMILPTDYYQYDESSKLWVDISSNQALLNSVINKGIDLKISGIVKPNEDATSAFLNGSLCYTSALTNYYIETLNNTEMIKQQINSDEYNIISGLPFILEETEELTNAEKIAAFKEYVNGLTDNDKVKLYQKILSTPKVAEVDATIDMLLKQYEDKTAEDIINDITSQYATELGYSEELIRDMLSGYTKEELIEIITETVKQMIVKQYEDKALKLIEEIYGTPSEQELQTMKLMVLSEMYKSVSSMPVEQQAIMKQQINYMFVASNWSQKTGMSSNDALTILKSMSLDDFNIVFNKALDETATQMYAQYSGMSSNADKQAKVAKAFDDYLNTLKDDDFVYLYENHMPDKVSDKTKTEILEDLGFKKTEDPDFIYIYPIDFENKEVIANMITEYNNGVNEEDKIEYTDMVALLMSSVSDIITAISVVLICFVSISLVVSSIMIGIITYISVLERTKEIGILRAVGASKKDVSRVFNAETMIIGLFAGVIGIGTTVLLCFPISWIARGVTNINSLTAVLPWYGYLLIVLSVGLTLIAGIFPSRMAAKKDPVVALRTE
ncbi:MAG: ABC transporter ATP-binding protein/permease [Erysipelotrichaceae bacterium]|nr:ABC transporter ATP-binding protein/permease [Erysipelotrichaceae bacterium]